MSVAARQRDVPALMGDVDRERALGVEQRGFVEQAHGAFSASGDPGVGGCFEQATAAGVAGGAEPRRAFARERGGRVCAALAGPRGRFGERVGGCVVESERGCTEVPGALVGVAVVGERPGKCAVHGATRGRVGSAVHRRADERVAELDAPISRRARVRPLGLLERPDVDADGRRGVGDEAEVGRRRRGDDEE